MTVYVYRIAGDRFIHLFDIKGDQIIDYKWDGYGKYFLRQWGLKEDEMDEEHARKRLRSNMAILVQVEDD